MTGSQDRLRGMPGSQDERGGGATSGYRISNEAFAAAITKFSTLEELELSKCRGTGGNESLEAIAKSCPRLKHFRLIKTKHCCSVTVANDGEALAISGMHELRSLELHRNCLTNKGLTMILNNCAHLELLIIRKCPNVTVDDALLAKCSRVMIVTLRADDYVCYKASSSSYGYCGWNECPTCDLFRSIRGIYDYDYGYDYDYYYSWYWGGNFFREELDNYEDYSRYLNGVYVTDLDDEEHSRIVAKSARRYLKTNTQSV